MNDLTLEQETALAYLFVHQEELPKDFAGDTHVRAILDLGKRRLVDVTTDLSNSTVFVPFLSEAAASRYSLAREQRRRFQALDDECDLLMLELAAEDKALGKKGQSKKERSVSWDLASFSDYQELIHAGLLDADWATNTFIWVKVTDRGRDYAEGRFEQMTGGTVVNIAPVFNNDGSSHSEASARSSSTIKDVTLGMTIDNIQSLPIDEATRRDAQQAVSELDAASKVKDKKGFAEKLEKVASIAKSSAELAEVILPFVKTAVGTLLL